MKLRQGFTLIELLIVVTIIAILAGAAIPYVQDYIDESRRARAKNDLDEIRNALALYELRRGVEYPNNDIASLIGPFLTKALVDPWGAAYVVNRASSTVECLGPDGKINSGDEITIDFRPRMAVTKVVWRDTNKDGLVTAGVDSLLFYVTRPLLNSTAASTGLTPSAAGAIGMSYTAVLNDRVASFPVAGVFVAGSDTVTIDSSNLLVDESLDTNTNYARPDVLKIVAE
ncbi:MAG TPA: prepilin-type N-terminal cleavage/methylation domain-containing protein [Candidatus Ozemobacteraceae bacterium]